MYDRTHFWRTVFDLSQASCKTFGPRIAEMKHVSPLLISEIYVRGFEETQSGITQRLHMDGQNTNAARITKKIYWKLTWHLS